MQFSANPLGGNIANERRYYEVDGGVVRRRGGGGGVDMVADPEIHK